MKDSAEKLWEHFSRVGSGWKIGEHKQKKQDQEKEKRGLNGAQREATQTTLAGEKKKFLTIREHGALHLYK